MGPAGTQTKLHRDVYGSYSWSTNVVGRKRWWLFPPHVTSYITRPNGETIGDEKAIPEDGSMDDLLEDWPDWELARQAMTVVEQEEGETIFVPSGWYHQVLNLTFCISINHNWSNSHNVESMYHAMVDAVQRVEDSIDDVKELLKTQHPNGGWEEEWRTIVQDLLKKDAGWDWQTFLEMVELNLCRVSSEGGPSYPIQWMNYGPSSELTGGSMTVSQLGSYAYRHVSPERRYVFDRVSPCITHFACSVWGQSAEYGEMLTRIRLLLDKIALSV